MGLTWKWTWSEDNWEFKIDKVNHFVYSWAAYYTFVHFGVSELWASVVTLIFGLLKEIKDVLFAEDDRLLIGGDGFSYKDVVYDVAGILGALLIDLVWPPYLNRQRTKEPAYKEDEIFTHDFPEYENVLKY